MNDAGRDKVARFPVVTGTEPCDDLIATLEFLLAEAKSGNLRAIAYATVRGAKCDETGTGWDGGHGTRMPLAGSVMMLGDRYAEALRKGE